MALIKRTPEQTKETTSDSIASDNPQSEESGNPAIKRKNGSHLLVFEQDQEVEPETEPVIISIRKTLQQPTRREKVKLTADIAKDLHTRLRIHALRTDRSIIQIIEGWIEADCPE